jgi:DNA-binding CsgD family transcriptional regulator
MKKITLFLADHLMKASASKDLLRTVRDAFKGIAFPGRPAPRLTRRQTEVLQLIGEGQSNNAIAGILSLSRKTVEKHRQLVMNKLDIHEVATLTRYAIASGIVESKTWAELVGRGCKRGGARSRRDNLDLQPGNGSGKMGPAIQKRACGKNNHFLPMTNLSRAGTRSRIRP